MHCFFDGVFILFVDSHKTVYYCLLLQFKISPQIYKRNFHISNTLYTIEQKSQIAACESLMMCAMTGHSSTILLKMRPPESQYTSEIQLI
jgi:hypothetical protein